MGHPMVWMVVFSEVALGVLDGVGYRLEDVAGWSDAAEVLARRTRATVAVARVTRDALGDVSWCKIHHYEEDGRRKW